MTHVHTHVHKDVHHNVVHDVHQVVQRLTGKWVEEHSDNLDNFMKALNVNVIKRAIGEHTKFHEEWSFVGDKITLKVSNPFKSNTSTFRLNELFEDDTMDGQKSKTIYSEESGKVMTRQHREPHNVIYCREILDDGRLKLTMTCEDVTPVVASITFVRED